MGEGRVRVKRLNHPLTPVSPTRGEKIMKEVYYCGN
jgi:hypothetical protein